MFSVRSTICCLLVVLCLLPCFVSCGTTDRINFLSYQTYPFHARGILTFDESEYEVIVTVHKAGDLILQLVSPQRLAGTVLEIRDGIASLTYEDLVIPLADGGYAAKEGLLLSAEIFSLSGNSYAGAGVTEKDGIRYSYATYTVPSGQVTVYLTQEKDRPVFLLAELNRHQFRFQFMNES
ncbi:MAG: hypothetical protein E7618_05150 [Ruminococcaceae bacterium]|nr:hypothetical protein [Oscillospiraceae bacterium]